MVGQLPLGAHHNEIGDPERNRLGALHFLQTGVPPVIMAAQSQLGELGERNVETVLRFEPPGESSDDQISPPVAKVV